MNTQSKDLTDQAARVTNFLGKDQEPDELIDGGDFMLAEDDDLQLADGLGDPSDMNGDDDIIELTDVVEELTDEVGVDEADSISLDSVALEEEEIIELVDVATDNTEMEEEVLELTDLVEDDTVEPTAMPIDVASADDEAHKGPVDGGLYDQDQSHDTEMWMDQEVADMQDVNEKEAIIEPSVETPDIVMGEEQSEAYETVEEGELVVEADESHEIPAQAVDSDGEKMIGERLSDEKIEAIITRVVKDTIEAKADRILLEVAEAAIAKEIEKIKKAL